MNILSVRESVSFGWTTFKSRPWFFVGIGVLLLLVAIGINLLETIVTSIGEALFGSESVITGVVVFIAGLTAMAASMLIELGRTAFFLRAHDNAAAAEIRDLWHPASFWSYVGTSILLGLVVVVGLILLIVPGIILAIIFGFSAYLVVDRGLMPIPAFKESARITKGSRWTLFKLGLALLGINILGALALLVGLFVSLPVSSLALVHAYRKLSSTAPSEVPVVEAAPVVSA